jgi:hypothetical protein
MRKYEKIEKGQKFCLLFEIFFLGSSDFLYFTQYKMKKKKHVIQSECDASPAASLLLKKITESLAVM